MIRCIPSIALVFHCASGASAQTAHGDTPKFWEEHTLVVAHVANVRHAENVKDIIESVVQMTVQQSVPNRFDPGKEIAIAFVRNLKFSPVRDRPQYAVDFAKGDRVMVMVTEIKGQIVPALTQVNDKRLSNALNAKTPNKPSDPTKPPEQLTFPGYTSFAMLPGIQLRYAKEDDAVVAETVKVCLALSERDPMRRLELIATILKTNPSERVTNVLRRSIEATLESSLRTVEEAKRLLKTTEKPGSYAERGVEGVVKSFDGCTIILDGDRAIKVSAKTEYFRETGLDLTPIKSEDVRPNATVFVATTKANGEEVAVRVVLTLFGMRNALPDLKIRKSHRK